MGVKQAHRSACRVWKFRDDVAVCGHGEPMYFFGGRWRCAVRVRERVRRDYHRAPWKHTGGSIRVLNGLHLGTLRFTVSERKALRGETVGP